MRWSKNLSLGIAIGVAISFLALSLRETQSFSNRHRSKRKFSNTESRHHKDKDTVAQGLAKKVRVLIWIVTNPTNLENVTSVLRDTWGKRVEKILYVSSETNTTFPTIGLGVPEGRRHLTAKTMKGFKYIYDHHFQDADWFMKVDDDTFVIIENLHYFLSNENHSAPIYFGHHFVPFVKQGYFSGGGGYVLSKEALRRLATKGMDSNLCRQDGEYEDVELGKCMELLDVKTGNSRDKLDRSRFHCLNLEIQAGGEFPMWYVVYDAKHGKGENVETISDYSISFHYVPPYLMRTLEHRIYHLRPYGMKFEDENLNVKK